MLAQSKEVQEAWRATQRTLDIKVLVDGKEYKATDINSLKYDSGAYSGDTFAIGSTYSNNVQIEFSHLIEGLKLGMEVRPSIGIKTSSGYVYEPLGVFIISSEIKMDRNNNLTTVSASDRFCGLEGSYVSKLTYPAKVLDVIAEICAQSGVKANANDLARLPHQEDLTAPITGQSYRKALGWIAQLYVGYALFDRQGLFTIRTISEPNYELDPSQYEQAGLDKNEAAYKINGIQCQVTTITKTRDGESAEETKTYQAGNATGSQIKLENNIMTQQRLDNIWEQLKDLTFYPYSLNWFGNPAVEAGDWLRLQDKQGNSFVVPNSGYTLDFNGGLSATSKADQTTSSDQMVSWQGSVSQAIKELQARRAPDGTVIFPPSVTEPPANAKFNDVWFKKNGNSTELWIFEKQNDGSGKWVRKDLTNDEIKEKVAAAQQGLSKVEADIITNKQKADADIEDLNKSIADNKKAADTDIEKLNKSIEENKRVADAGIDNLNKSIEANKKTADESLQKLNDSVANLQGQYDNNIVPDLNKAAADAANALQKYIEAQKSIADLTKQAQQQGKDIADVTSTVNGLNINYANLAGDVSSTKADVKGLQTTIGTANGDIAQLKLDAQSLQTMLAGKVDDSVYQNFVTLTNQALAAKLTVGDLAGYAKTTELQATANGLQLNIDSISGKLDNMVLGNRNLIRNSGFPQDTNHWQGDVKIATNDFYYQRTKNLFVICNSGTSEKTAGSVRFPVKRNTNYVFSFKGFQSQNLSNYDVWFLGRKLGETKLYTYTKAIISARILKTDGLQYVKNVVFNSGENDEAYIRFDNNSSTDGADAALFFTEVKLEEGTKSTAWTAAPEDEQERVNGIASALSARITANSQQFSSYYTKSEADIKADTAKNDAVDAIKSDTNWAGLTNIITNSGFLQSADGFVQKVQQTTLPMFNGGGLNLLRMSSFHHVALSQLSSAWGISPRVSIDNGTIKSGAIKLDSQGSSDWTEIQQQIAVDPDTDYTFSMHLIWGKADSAFHAHVYMVEYGIDGKIISPYADNVHSIVNNAARSANTYTIHTSKSTHSVRLYIRAEVGSMIEFDEVKLERGSVATPWSPNPADLATQIAVTELTQTVNGLQTTVSGNYGDLQTQISQTDAAIRGELSNQIISVTNQITATADGLNTKIANLQIGGTNLVRNSGNFQNTAYWRLEKTSAAALTIRKHAFWKNAKENVLMLNNESANEASVASSYFDVKPNTTYTISFWAFHDDWMRNCDLYFLGRKYNSASNYTVVVPVFTTKRFSSSHATYVVKSFNTGATDEGYICFDHNGILDDHSSSALYLADIKVEKGDKATAWSPSPKDTTEKFAEINTTISGLQSTVSDNYGNLQSQISQTATAIRGELTDSATGLQTQITTTANGLNARIDNIRVGGRNLLRGTAKFDFPFIINSGEKTIKKYDDDTNYIQLTSDKAINNIGLWFRFTPEVGQTYTFSADVCGNGYIPGDTFHYEGGGSNSLSRVDLTNDWQRISNTFRVNTISGNWAIYAQNSTLLKVKHIKIEKGNVATDWTSAPEDIEQQFTELNATINGLQSTVSGNYNTLQTKISQTATAIRGELTNSISGLQTKITANSNGLNSAVGRVDSLETLTSMQVVGKAIDANAYTNTGNYFVKSSASTNVPMTSWFYLEVKKASDGRIIQTWQADNEPAYRYVRTYNGTWSGWKRPASYAEYSNLSQTVQGLQSTISGNYNALTNQISQTNQTTRDEINDKVKGLQGQLTLQSNNFNVSLNSLRNETAWQTVTSPINADSMQTTGNYWIQATPNTNTPDNGAWAYLRVVAYPAVKRVLQVWQRDNDENQSYTRLFVTDKWTAWQKNVTSGNILAQINMSADATLIKNSKIYMDASSTIFSGNAFIPSAAITSLNADKINAGTINGAKVNVINLNANNITAGTLKGSNGEFFLDSGSLHVWQDDHNTWIDKNGVHDYENGNDTWIQQGQLAVTNSNNEGFFSKNGNIELTSRELWGAGQPAKYGTIKLGQNLFNAGGTGMEIIGHDGFFIHSENYSGDDGLLLRSGKQVTGAAIGGNNGNLVAKAHNLIELRAGNLVSPGKPFSPVQPYIDIGANANFDEIDMFSSQLRWSGPDSEQSLYFLKDNKSFDVYASPITYISINDKTSYTEGLFNVALHGQNVLTSTSSSTTIGSKGLYVKDFYASGSKNAIVPTSRGMAAINAYETAEYYFGDIGETQTDANGVVRVMIDPLFLETVNTLVPYQVFLTAYGDANVWIDSRSANSFIVKSSKPNIHFAWEIKAKRKGYENDRMKIVKGVFNNE